MKVKKWLSMILIVSMLASLAAGCGGNSENGGGKEPESEGAETESGADGETSEETDQEEPAEITVVLRTLGTVEESGYEAVQEAVNEITESKINVTVHLQWIDSAAYGTQVPMMITGNEPLDLMMFTPNPSTTYNTMMAQNQLMDITDLVEEYGPAIKETLGDQLLAATSKDGKVYGVGTYGTWDRWYISSSARTTWSRWEWWRRRRIARPGLSWRRLWRQWRTPPDRVL